MERQLLETIYQSITIGDERDIFNLPYCYCLNFSSEPTFIIKCPTGINAHQKIVKMIFKNSKINEHFTFKDVEKELDRVLIKSIYDQKHYKKDDDIVRTIKKSLKPGAKKEYHVYREISGISLNRYRKFGNISFHRSANVYKKIRPDGKPLGEICVCIKIIGTSRERTLEIADNIFHEIEYSLGFIIGRKKGYEVSILSPSRSKQNSYLLAIEGRYEGAGWSLDNHSSKSMDFSDVCFQNPIFRKIISLPGNCMKTELEKKIPQAIKWVGLGLKSKSSIESTIYYATAMETLIVEKDSLITPSIMVKLSEMTAFLLGENIEQRIKIVKEVKKVYSQRSAGVHGGNPVGNEDIEEMALYISRQLVFKYLELVSKKINTPKQIQDYINKLKYGP